MMNKPTNACALCGQCTVTCPNGYDMAEICLAARRNMVDTDKMPLAPHEFALNDQEFSNTEAFLCRPQPGFDKCRYVFFPGCQASAIAPDTVEAAYRDLAARLPGGVGLILGCCGAISEWAGRTAIYDETVKMLGDSLRAAWRPHRRGGLPDLCQNALRSGGYGGHRDMGRAGRTSACLPEREGPGYPRRHARFLRRPGRRAHPAGRKELAEKMGCTIVETEYSGDSSPCCGYGGLVQYANPQIAHEMSEKCVSRSGPRPYITYCMACRDRMAQRGPGIPAHSGAGLRHGRGLAAGHKRKKRYNRLTLKKRLLNDIWKETTPEMNCGFEISYLPEARAAMDERMILESDVDRACWSTCARPARLCMDCETGCLSPGTGTATSPSG
jgi:hypothetical protein